MMGERIYRKFRELQKKGEKALITYITFNFPDPERFRLYLKTIIEAGSDMIEIGIPFSDPIADGPVIQKASERSLSFGSSLKEVLRFIEKEKEHIPVPVILMGYMNPFLRFGIENLKNSGADGFIIPDISYEEALRFNLHRKIPLIQLIAPTTPLQRAERIAKSSCGFIYYISITGITGSKIKDFEEIMNKVEMLKKRCSLPIAVGFGIHSPEDVKKICSSADGVVVGSSLLKMLEEENTTLPKIADFISSLKKATSCT